MWLGKKFRMRNITVREGQSMDNRLVLEVLNYIMALTHFRAFGRHSDLLIYVSKVVEIQDRKKGYNL